jgi:hypothetical protein
MQRAVSAQMAERSLVKVHTRMHSAKRVSTQRTQNQVPQHHQAWCPMVEHAVRVNIVTRTVLLPSLSLAPRWVHTCSPVQVQQQHALTKQQQQAQSVKHTVSLGIRFKPELRFCLFGS